MNRKAVGSPSAPTKKKANKYHNVKVTIDGIRFDSKKEARRWLELQTLLNAGKIINLERQKRYKFIINKVNCGAYVADFVYFDTEKQCEVVEDVKSKHTRLDRMYRRNRKMMKAIHGIEVTEVVY